MPTIPIINEGTTLGTVRDTYLTQVAGQQPIQLDLSERIYDVNFSADPLLVILEALPTGAPGTSTTHIWREDRHVPERATLDGSHANNATILTLATGQAKYFTVYDTVWTGLTTNGYASVSNVDITLNQITIVWIDTPTVALDDGSAIICCGPGHPQDTTVKAMPTTVPVEVKNYFENILLGVTMTDQYAKGRFQFSPDDHTRQLAKMREVFNTKREKKLWWGHASLNETGTLGANSGIATLGGIHDLVTTNIKDLASVALTRPVWDTFLEDYTSKTTAPNPDWWFFNDGGVNKTVSQWAQPFEQTTTRERQFGTFVATYLTPGTGQLIKMKAHPLFKQLQISGYGVLLNMASGVAKQVFHSDFVPRMGQSVMPYGRTCIEDFIRCVQTLEFNAEEVNAAKMINIG